jgi:hypothetical protein
VCVYVCMYLFIYIFIYLLQMGIYNCDENRTTGHFVSSSQEFESQPCQPKMKDYLIGIYIKLIVTAIVQTV